MGIRVIKTAIACVVAIYIARWIGVNNPLSAGLLAILGVDVTLRRSLLSVSARFLASVLGLLFASLIFWLAGFTPIALGVFILVTYPVLGKVKLKDGIITGSVVVFHIFTAEDISLHAILNEITLLLIGLGTAVVVNALYMPRFEKEMLMIKDRVEAAFSAIFAEFSASLRDSRHEWSGGELIIAGNLLEKGNHLAEKTDENSLFGRVDEWPVYFAMRAQQLDSIQRMLGLVSQVYQTIPQGEIVADVFGQLSGDVKNEFYTGIAEEKLLAMERQFKQMPLPATRDEFEVRSSLLQLCIEVKQFLDIAKKEKKRRPVL